MCKFTSAIFSMTTCQPDRAAPRTHLAENPARQSAQHDRHGAETFNIVVSLVGMREALNLISSIVMAQSIQHCGHMRSECKVGFEKVRLPGIEPGPQAEEACMMPLHYLRLARFIRFLAH